MTTKRETDRSPELDSLRGIAALMVVFFHFTMGRPEAAFGLKLGTTGVDLFFIISGFVIFMSLNKITNSMDFVIKRISRLYPTYWASVTFSFLILTSFTIYKNQGFAKIDLIKYLGNMTMFQYYLNIPDLEGPYWTMIIEMIFYMAIVFLFQFKLLKYLNIIGISLSILFVILEFFWADEILVEKIVWWIPLLPFIPLFFAGIIFYKIYRNKKSKFKITQSF